MPTSTSGIKEGLDQAQVLHALYLGAVADAETAQTKGSSDRQRLKTKYDADLLKVAVAEKDAADKAAEAKDTLVAFQANLKQDTGASIDLLQATRSGSTRL